MKVPLANLKFYFEPKALLGFISIFIVIVLLAVASAAFIRDLVSVSRASSQSKQIVLHSERIRTSVADLQSFFARHESGFTEAPVTSVLRHQTETLLQLTSGDSAVAKTALKIRQGIEDLLSKSTLAGKVLPDSVDSQAAVIRSLIDRLQDIENAMIQQRAETATHQYYRFEFSFFGMVIVVVVLLVILVSMLNRHLQHRAHAEDKLVKASAVAYDLYENAPCGYFSFDRNGTVDGINTTLARWLQVSPATVIGHYNINEFVTLNVESLLNDNLRFIKEGNVISNEHGFIKKTGATENLPVVLNATPLWNGQQFIGARCTVFDSTEIQRAHAETKRTNSELEAFSYSVSHDLRAPLRSVGGYAEIIKEDNYERLDEDGKNAIDKVIRNARRMGDLIDDLLNFSRISRREIVKVNINMNALVDEIVMEVGEQKGSKPSIIVSALHDAPADLAMIRQVWMNLLSNAIKYSSKRPTAIIEIFGQQDGENAIYHVRDNGSGFDMAYYDKLFGVFSRLHRADEFDGTGVGLALSKRIIEKHGGTIWAEARIEHGATFSFSIPNPIL